MTKQIIQTNNAPQGIGVYSQGISVSAASGKMYYFSGQIGLEPNSMKMAEGFVAQLQQIFKNIDGLLEAAKLKRSNVIKTTVFLQSMDDFPKLNAAYKEYFQDPYPARSCVQVAQLPAKALVEIEVIASDDII